MSRGRTGSPIRLNRPVFDEWRAVRRLTSKAVAAELGIDPTTLAKLRHGVHGCSALTVARFWLVYQIPIRFGEDEMYLYDSGLTYRDGRTPTTHSTTN